MTGQPEASGMWLRRFHPGPPMAPRLVCFPHAGGSASFFFPVSQAMSAQVEVLAVQYPGRHDRRGERGIETIAELADAITAPLMRKTELPIALFGHSMGATVAFEVALRLEQRGIRPIALFASGRRAPSRHRDENVHLRDDDGLIAELRMLNGTDAGALGNEELLRMALPAIRSDYTAAETYRYQPGPRLNTPIYAHIGEHDPRVTADEANAWQNHTSQQFELHSYPGGHFYLHNESPRLIKAISEVLSRSVQAG